LDDPASDQVFLVVEHGGLSGRDVTLGLIEAGANLVLILGKQYHARRGRGGVSGLDLGAKPSCRRRSRRPVDPRCTQLRLAEFACRADDQAVSRST
jgi:hypothetical protein